MLDSESLAAAFLALPEDLHSGAERISWMLDAPADEPPSSIVCFAGGHEAIACEMLSSVAASRSSVPIVVVRGATVPVFVGPESLVFAVVGPDDEPEPVSAALAAAALGAAVVAIAPSEHGALMLDDGEASVELRVGAGARRSLGTVLATLLITCESFGALPGAADSLRRATEHLTVRREGLLVDDGGLAQALARQIGRTFPIITGSSGIGASAARRWAAQIASTAKLPAFASSEPDRSMIDLAGFGQAGDITRQIVTLLELRDEDEDVVTTTRFSHAQEYLTEAVAAVINVEAVGTDPLARLLDLVLLGDLVALHLASKEGLDPGPAPVVGDVARAVAASRVATPTLRPGGP